MKIELFFYAGESRYSDKGVNYLLGADGANEIYAECEVPEGTNYSDDYGYLTMKAAIVKALQAAGVSLDQVSFQYDGQERFLAPDASAACEVRMDIEIRKIVYSVIGSTAEMHYDGKKPPILTQETIQEALFGECTSNRWTRAAEFDTEEDAVDYLKKHDPEVEVRRPEGMGVKYVPVRGSAVLREEKVITVDDGHVDIDYEYDGAEAYSHYRPTVTNASGSRVDFEAAVPLMDDDLREQLHARLSPCSPQEFFTAYEEAHAEKYGEDWALSKENPTW